MELCALQGFEVAPIDADGNCQFSAIAQQLGPDIGYKDVRSRVVKRLRQWADEQTVDENFFFIRDDIHGYEAYLSAMEQDGTWGDHLTLLAAAVEFNLNIHVITTLGDGYVSVNVDQSFRDGDARQIKDICLAHQPELHYQGTTSMK